MEGETASEGLLASPSFARSLFRLFAWSSLALVPLIHVLFAHHAYAVTARICAGILGSLALLSMAYHKAGTVPAVQVLLANLYVSASYPTFSETKLYGARGHIRLSSQSLDYAAIGCLLFAGLIFTTSHLGMFVGQRFLRSSLRVFDVAASYEPRYQLGVRVMGLLCAFACMLASIKGGIPLALTNIVAAVASPAVAVALLYWDFANTGSKLSQALLWLAVGVTAFGGLLTGMVGNTVAPALALGLAIWMHRGRPPLGLIAVGLLLVVVLSPVKHVYRTLTWNQHGSIGQELDVSERIENWNRAFDRTYSGSTRLSLTDSAKVARDRMAMLPQVAHIFEWVPRYVRFAGPDEWLQLPTYYVPRIFWSSKPTYQRVISNYMVTFGFRRSNFKDKTSIALPAVGDGYWRLGWWGVVFEGCVLGLLTGLFQGLASMTSLVTFALGISYALTLRPERHVVAFLAALPQLCIGVCVVVLAARLLAEVLLGATRSPPAASTQPPRA